LIDFDGPSLLRKQMDTDELNYGSPYEEVTKSIKDRLLFLLELSSSVDY
jgi:hypothetical protein